MTELIWLTNESKDNAARTQKAISFRTVVGDPKATDKNSVEELKEFNMVGIYKC